MKYTTILQVPGVVLAMTIACSQQRDGQTNSPGEDRFAAGKILYDQHCATCHMADGSGAAPMNPPLVNTSFVVGDEAQLIGIILNGMKGTEVDGVKYKNVMPPFAFLTDEEIAAVLTYVRNNFGNHAADIDPETVRGLRK